MTILSPLLRNDIGGKAVLVVSDGLVTIFNASFGAGLKCSTANASFCAVLNCSVEEVDGEFVEVVVVVEVDVVKLLSYISGSFGDSSKRFSGGPTVLSNSILASNVGVGMGSVKLSDSVGMYTVIGREASLAPNMGNLGAYADTKGNKVSLA